MNERQVIVDYRQAKNHKRQIPILAELNACDKEKIIEILRENGYKMIFNTNGADISLKQKEMLTAYMDGKTVQQLSKQYHVSAKTVRELLEITEETDMANEAKTENKNTEVDLAELEKLRAENAKLREEIEHQEERIDNLNEECEGLRCQLSDMEQHNRSINENYQDICIRNSQLNVAIDVLVDKISRLRAVGCNGR